ncbi:hypothetical protein GCM10010185_52820 [Saccharothrix coeruleofusca]|uniref:Uncharacterized protein n=2 Tax=Saccharothrix coeruleofusca TaxID=33919 RepID=A0A918ARI8_9PSEU|nr:hypothetical protein GCM10010185_52820 [Saccharothrix coeruleofusca]
MWAALRAGITGKRDVPPGTTAVPYDDDRAVLLCMVVLSIVEIIAVDVLLPWLAARVVLLVLGLYGLVWITALYLSLSTHPHLVGPRELRLRHGFLKDTAVALAEVAAVRREVDSNDGAALRIGPATSNVVVELTDGRRVRFHANNPDAAVQAVRKELSNRSA